MKKPNPVGKKIRPKTKQELWDYLQTYLNLTVPFVPICQNTLPMNYVIQTDEIHTSPMDYVWYAFSADFKQPTPHNADAVVWANRGGGKTKLAAALTLLDCIFKPKCQIRILSGSGDQAGRMYDFLIEFVTNGFEHLTCGRITKSHCSFTNKSMVEVLKQSETSVRSHHVNKVRCDEVELFGEKVFDAAKLTTQSTLQIVSAFEIISTMNNSWGLMRKVIKLAKKINMPIFKWCLWDVIEKCENRNCETCPLSEDCQGIAKKGMGYYKIEDAISHFLRSYRRNWVYEMLCNPKTGIGQTFHSIKMRRY